MNKRSFFSVIVWFFLTGCKANKESLELFYAEAKKQGHIDVEQLTTVSTFDVDGYSQIAGRSPFVLPKRAELSRPPINKKTCWQPKYRKKMELLEQYSLNKLSFKGIIGSGSDITALVQIPKGNIVKVSKGQFMGSHHGRVLQINSQYVLLKETLPDGVGCWQQRHIKLVLKN